MTSTQAVNSAFNPVFHSRREIKHLGGLIPPCVDMKVVCKVPFAAADESNLNRTKRIYTFMCD